MTSNALQLLESLLTEARDAISQVTPSPSYRYVADLAAAYRRVAGRLAGAIEASREVPPIACKRGCAQCCYVPSMLRPPTPEGRTGDIFGMSILDLVTLVESFPEIEGKLGADIGERMIGAARAAMGSVESQPCPFLTEGNDCGIYPFRPSTCQIWFSADLETCTYNRFHFYLRHDLYASTAGNLRATIEHPFQLALARQFPDLPFRRYDYLASFKMVAEHRQRDGFAAIRDSFGHRAGQFFAPLLTPPPD